MSSNPESPSVASICEVLGYSRQAYYQGRSRLNKSEEFENKILLFVREVRFSHPMIGTRKIVHILRNKYGIEIGRDRLFLLLREQKLLIRRRRSTRTTNSNHGFRKYADLAKNVRPISPNFLWVADITYVQVGKGFCYLSLLTDSYSRKIIGYDFSDNLMHTGALNALKMAVREVSRSGVDLSKIIHHSDRGVQYCCHEYTGFLHSRKMTISMTESGDPRDNAQAERVNGILKNEYGIRAVFASEAEARRAVKQAIFCYNTSRPHLSLGMLTPEEVHVEKKKISGKTMAKSKQSFLNEAAFSSRHATL